MGSPISAVVSNLYMEFFEKLPLSTSTAQMKVLLWKSYVDDTCCIVKKGTAEVLLNYLNSMQSFIKVPVNVGRD